MWSNLLDEGRQQARKAHRYRSELELLAGGQIGVRQAVARCTCSGSVVRKNSDSSAVFSNSQCIFPANSHCEDAPASVSDGPRLDIFEMETASMQGRICCRYKTHITGDQGYGREVYKNSSVNVCCGLNLEDQRHSRFSVTPCNGRVTTRELMPTFR